MVYNGQVFWKELIVCSAEIRKECVIEGIFINRKRITDFAFNITSKGITDNMGVFLDWDKYNQVKI